MARWDVLGGSKGLGPRCLRLLSVGASWARNGAMTGNGARGTAGRLLVRAKDVGQLPTVESGCWELLAVTSNSALFLADS